VSTYKYYVPALSIFGYGCIDALSEEFIGRNYKNALIVTDKGVCDLGIADKIIDVVKKAGMQWALFNDVKPNPTTGNVEAGLRAFREHGCDCIVTIGGGSAHDCGKAISILAANGGRVQDYVGMDRAAKKGPDIIAVNTTAGTGSECTRAYVITDEENHRKYGIRDRYAQAAIAVDDHALMMSLPRALTAGTGMDALTHAVECLTSRRTFMLANELAMAAIRVIFRCLPRVVENPEDEEAREGMAAGQYLAGLAFGNGGVGLVHAMSHQLSAVYDLPHGLCNAILLPAVMDYNKRASAAQYAEIARLVAPVESQGKTDEELAELAIRNVRELSGKVGTRRPLSGLGVKRGDFTLLAEQTKMDGSYGNNPVLPEIDDIMKIYGSVYDG
jgi:alcohol dehydrogenase